MPHEEQQDLVRLVCRFLAERHELGDGFWPEPSAASASTPSPEKRTVERRDVEQPDAPAAGGDASEGKPVPEAGVTKPPSPPVRRPQETSEPALVAPPRQLSLVGDRMDAAQWENLSLEEFGQAISQCQRCPLGATRTKFVFGVGNPRASLVFIGEAPGADEDRQGIPFVGRAGQLLTKMIEAMKLRREDVYIGNVLKCRPPENRSPLPSEMEECLPYLEHQIELIRPKIICALGRVAAQVLLQTTEGLSRLRGRWHDYHGIKVMVTYHPAALLRNPHWKHESWDDLKKLRLELDGTVL